MMDLKPVRVRGGRFTKKFDEEWAVQADFDGSGYCDPLQTEMLHMLSGVPMVDLEMLAHKLGGAYGGPIGRMLIFPDQNSCRRFIDEEVMPPYMARTMAGEIDV